MSQEAYSPPAFPPNYLYDAEGSWVPLSTEVTGSQGPWQAKLLGGQPAGPLDGDWLSVKWDFLDLRDQNLGQATYQGSSLIDYDVHGMLWLSTREIANDLGPGATQNFSHTYLSGNSHARVTSKSIVPIHAPAGWPMQRFCPACPQGITRLAAIVDDPYLYAASPTGLIQEASAPASLRNLYASIADGDRMYLEAAEPLSLLASRTVPGNAILQGVALDDTISVSEMLYAQSFDALATTKTRVPHHGTPTLRGNEGIVLSATERRVFVIGGTRSGRPAGLATDEAWSLDIDTNLWSSFPIALGRRPHDVLGATYRWQDHHVYEIDVSALPAILRLRRWTPGEEPSIRALLPAAWRTFDRTWLVPDRDGNLLFAATRDGGPGKHTLLARFGFDSDGRLQFDGAGRVDDVLLASPYFADGQVSAIVADPRGGRIKMVTPTNFLWGHDADDPEIEP